MVAVPFTDSLFAPKTEAELLARVRRLSGRTIGEVARAHGRDAPTALKNAKGFVGELCEAALGAPRSSRPGPDFAGLDIELKTLPVDDNGRPTESTYVSRVDAALLVQGHWETSRVRTKLARVLFIPVQSTGPVAQRMFGAGFLWSVHDDEDALRRDWEDFADWAARGALDEISARRGEVLQLRPKAPDSRRRQVVRAAGGDEVTLSPRGFYLRPAFTAGLLARAFAEVRA